MIAQCHSTEMFRDSGFLAAGPVTDFLPTGEQFALSVPAEAEQRYLWICAGNYQQGAVDDRWFIQGRITFYLSTTQVGFLEFSDASSRLSAAERLIAPRTVTRAADNSGGDQPSIRYQVSTPVAPTVWERQFIDIPCISIRCKCDRITYSIDKSYYLVDGRFLTGLRCVSNAA